jgi:hypothetical protein
VLLISALVASLGVSGCATTSKSPSRAPAKEAPSATKADVSGVESLASPSSGYVDPMVASASSVTQDGNSSEGDYAAQPAPGIGELVTQPTGVRAGSVSIFSAPAQPHQVPAVSEPVAAPVAPGRVNATAGSVFSAPAPTSTYSSTSCGTADDGVAISC